MLTYHENSEPNIMAWEYCERRLQQAELMHVKTNLNYKGTYRSFIKWFEDFLSVPEYVAISDGVLAERDFLKKKEETLSLARKTAIERAKLILSYPTTKIIGYKSKYLKELSKNPYNYWGNRVDLYQKDQFTIYSEIGNIDVQFLVESNDDVSIPDYLNRNCLIHIISTLETGEICFAFDKELHKTCLSRILALYRE